MHVDRWFGSGADDLAYRSLYGSLAPAVLWDRYDGMHESVRFNVYVPLPQLDQRLGAFIGRVDPNEYITEQAEPSGAFQRQYGPATTDETLLGLSYREPDRPGGRFIAGAGIRLSLPLDPYVKGGYVYSIGAMDEGLLTVKGTAFWQHSQGVGVTTRTDLQRTMAGSWLMRWTTSETFSQQSLGVAAWSTADLIHVLAPRRAVAFEAEIDGQTEAPVPLHDFGAKIAYRQSVLRPWLILEVRTSIDWPKDLAQQDRRLNPGVGVGLEMLFGTDKFLARPVTF